MVRSIFYITSVLVYSGIFISRRAGISLPGWINRYVTDLLALPLILSLVVVVMRKFRKESPLFLNWKMILFAWIYISIIFEWALPQFSSRYAADVIDIVMYFFGAVFFYLVQRKLLPPRVEKESMDISQVS